MTHDAEAPDLLQRIVARRRERLAGERDSAAAPPGPQPAAGPNPFLAALESRRGGAVIGEIKLGSPRLGSLVGRLDPERQARLYAAHGATALSVVVEPDFFQGSYELLRRCREACGLPALAKDFVVEESQLDAARRAGADAVLLIATLLPAAELRRLAAAARALGLVPLVEIHGEEDLDRLGSDAWELVGVNSRDLKSFAVDLGRCERMAERLPAGALRVAESGIAGGSDVRRLAAAGYEAFLVGESLLLAADPAALLDEMVAG